MTVCFGDVAQLQGEDERMKNNHHSQEHDQAKGAKKLTMKRLYPWDTQRISMTQRCGKWRKPPTLTITWALWILITLLALQDHAAFAVCGGNYAGTLNGNLSTPNYPLNYPDSSNCLWIIHCPYNHYVTVSLPKINIEEDKTCAFDYLVFHDGNSPSRPELPPDGSLADLKQNRVCGSLNNMKWTSTSYSITAKFISDDSTSEKGFSGTWHCKQKLVVTTTRKTETLATTTRPATTPRHTRKQSSEKAPTGARPNTSNPSHSLSTVQKTNGATGTKDHGVSRPTGISQVITVGPTSKAASAGFSCKEDFYKKIVWDKTVSETIAQKPCPTGSTGFAARKCLLVNGQRAKWSNFVDTSNCISLWVKAIDNQVKDSSTPSMFCINELNSKTTSNVMFGGDLIKVTEQLKELTSKAKRLDLQNGRKPDISKLNSGFMSIGNNLLDSNAWTGLTQKKRMRTASKLLKHLEDIALVAIQAQSERQPNSKDFLDAVTPNIVASSRVLHVKGNASVALISNNLKNNASLKNTDWKSLGQVEIPQRTIKDVADGKKKCFAACIVVRNVDKLLSAGQSDDGNGNKKTSEEFVNTYVTSLALSPKPKRKFPAPVVITTKSLMKTNPKTSTAKCSFLDTNSSVPFWSQSGVSTVAVSADETICHTSHFTNFAVLMKTGTPHFGARHKFALMIITQVGIGVSLLCLILALSIFINCKSLKSVRNTIHKNLCVALAFAYVVFVVGISRTEHRIVCTVFATLLYYFLLVAFMWMLMEGIQLYILLVQIFPRGHGFTKQYYAICWGFPAVLSVVLCGSHPHGFGNSDFCWLSARDHFIWAFVVPVLIIIVVNSVFLIMTFRTIIRNSSIITREQDMRRTIDKIGHWAKGSIGLVPLLGITWLFGVLYINDDTVIMAYLFTFCNAFQGLYIFIFYCVMNDKVKEDFRRRFCAISRSSSHSFTAASKKSLRGSTPLSLSAINFPWNTRRGTETAKDVIVVHDPTVVRNGTTSTGTSSNVNGTFSKRYQDIIREDATVPDDTAALKGYTIGNGNENIEYRISLHSTESRDSHSDLMSPDTTRLGGMPCESNGHISHASIAKCDLDEDSQDIEEHENFETCTDGEEPIDPDDITHDSADEFEERVMRAIERNLRRTISEEDDVAIDMYDNETVYV